ncbi:MAG: IclR family transcriptional regulator [Chloroflexota bacterium]
MSVQSIERAFALLRAIAEHPDGVSVTELARYTDLHKSTVSRLIIALEKERAIERDNGSLLIGNGIAKLLSSTLTPSSLQTFVRPYLTQLADATEETVGLCVPDGDMAYFVDQIASQHAVQIRNWTGERLPLNAVSSGKLFLAYSKGNELADYLSRTPLEKQAPNTIVNRHKLLHRIDQVRNHGYDWSIEEFTEGLCVVSAPIFDSNNELVASIYVCGPVFRFPPEGKKHRITQLVVDTCTVVSRQIQSIGKKLHVNTHGRSPTPTG